MEKTTWLITAALLFGCLRPAAAIDTDRAEVREFINTMVTEHEFDRAQLTTVLQAARSHDAILDSIARPAERTLSWGEYRGIFLTDERIAAGRNFWREHEATLDRIGTETGVTPAMLVGIIGVETYFGRITGDYRVLDALSTLAFDYPPRAVFFRRELEQFLLLTREEGIEPSAPTGSYAGAMGSPQFMPSSYRAYAVDASNDGKRDIWSNWADVIGSVANYFVAHGWRRDAPVVTQAEFAGAPPGNAAAHRLEAGDTVGALRARGVRFAQTLPADAAASLFKLDAGNGDEYWVGLHNFFVITRYNRSVMYALAVYQLGQAIAAQVAAGSA